MKIALVHDYLNEFGGAERVLKTLSDMYPDAPIYTAFIVGGSVAANEFAGRKVIESRFAPLLKIKKLYSPLRFLAPKVWESFDFSDFDIVITSASWYITRGFKVGPNTKVICYCHTPPRYLYGYETSVNLQKYPPVWLYALVVNHFLRKFDYQSAQKVDQFVANSENVKKRIAKFYRKDSIVIYPPIEVQKMMDEVKTTKKKDYMLIVSRLVGAKGLEEAAKAAALGGFNLKIAGKSAGFADVEERLVKLGKGRVELLGRVGDDELVDLYTEAQGFIALAREEDFGMTVVESLACGTPVLAYKGGGFLETVIEGENGYFVESIETDEIAAKVRKLIQSKWDNKKIQKTALKFDRSVFEKQIREVVENI
jgi:glycosyltransferase involved in cell wall biosynthesis